MGPIVRTIAEKLTMTTSTEIRKRNEELAQAINEEARRNPHSPYAGKWVGLANGQVVVVADSRDELAKRLREVEPDPARTFWVEASRDYAKVFSIWEMH